MKVASCHSGPLCFMRFLCFVSLLFLVLSCLQDDKSVVDELLSSKHVVVAIKFCIISGHKELRDTAIDLLRGNEKVSCAAHAQVIFCHILCLSGFSHLR